MDEFRTILRDKGFGEEEIAVFLENCSIRPETGQTTGPMILREGIVANKTSGALAYSIKPYNLILNIPKLVAAATSLAWSFHS